MKNEFKALSYLVSNPEYLYKFDSDMFTNGRIEIYHAIGKSYSEYGIVTPEALERYCTLHPDVFAYQVAEIQPILDDLIIQRNKRRIKATADKLAMLAESDNPSYADAQELLFEGNDYKETSLAQSGMTFLQELHAKRTGSYEFISTGFRAFDIMLGGEWPKKEVSILSAFAGTGKTALVGCTMLAMAKQNHASLMFSLEMPASKLFERWISNLCSINGMDIKTGKVSEEEIKFIQEQTNYVASLPMYVIDDPMISVNSIAATIRNYVKQKDVKVVFIDHLQILQLDTDNRNIELGLATKLFKNLAKSLNIHICILSQVNKDNGIRDSGDVIANIDTRIMLETEDTGDMRDVKVSFLKNRNGKLGIVPMLFYSDIQRFEG